MNYTIEEYRKAELKMLDAVDWNPQFTSILEFIEFFLSQGILFSSDEIIISSKDTNIQTTCAMSPRTIGEKKSIDHLNQKF